MIRLRLNPEFESLLRKYDLNSYAAFMNCDLGDSIEAISDRDTRQLQLDDQVFFLKRDSAKKTGSALENYLIGRLAHSKPYNEMLHFKLLRNAGFNVAEVVAVGEELILGIPSAGFIMTKKVDGMDLSELYRLSDGRDRRCILFHFGALVGRLHNCGLFGGIRLKDIICEYSAGAAMKMTLIDRETHKPYSRRTTRKRVLSKLMLNIHRQTKQGETFSEREWKLFCHQYCQELSASLRIDRHFLAREIRRLLQRHERHQADRVRAIP